IHTRAETRGLDQQRSGEQLSARSLSTPRNTRSTGRSYPWRQLIHQLRPLLLDQLSHIIGDLREALRLKQEFVQPLEILLHHDVVGDNPRGINSIWLRRSHFQYRCSLLVGWRMS